MRHKVPLGRNITSAPMYSSTGPNNKIIVRISFALIVAMLLLLNGLFNYLVMCTCRSTIVRVNGTVQFTFFSVMRLNITIVTSCNSLIVMLVP